MLRSKTLELIEEVEQTAILGKGEERTFKEEVEWMKKLVETHPVLRRLPQHIKSRLAVEPTSWSTLPANRRTRKRMQRNGFMAHMFAGEHSGFTLACAWHQQGGEAKLPPFWSSTSKEAHIMTFQQMWGPMQN
jgi:hypothetical protein